MVSCQSIFSILSGQYISRCKRYGEVIWAGFGIWTLYVNLDLISSFLSLPENNADDRLLLAPITRGAGLILIFSQHTHPAVIAVIVAVVGIGLGFTFQPTLVALQSHCTKSQRAVAISNRNFFRCMGGACGLAVSAALLQATLRSNLPENYKYLAHSSYSVPARSTIPDAQWMQIQSAYAKASRSVFTLQVPLIGVCFLGCIFLRDRGLERPKETEDEETHRRGVTMTQTALEGGEENGADGDAAIAGKSPSSDFNMHEERSQGVEGAALPSSDPSSTAKKTESEKKIVLGGEDRLGVAIPTGE